jgi:hypothetical protein
VYETGADARPEVTRAARQLNQGVNASLVSEASNLTPEARRIAVAVSRSGLPGHPHGERQQFDSWLWKMPRREGSHPSSFEVDFEELSWKV